MSGRPNGARAARILASLTACAGLTLTTVDAVQARPAGSEPPEPNTASTTVQGPDHTSRAFFRAVLTRLKLPVTQPNLDALYAVEHREGDNDRFNPLNVVQPEPGSSSYNSVGVQRYANFRTGVDGTVHLLRNGHWTGVRAALRQGDSRGAVLAAFSDAYTWDNGITFLTDRALLDAEAVRDVGGRYSDTGLAAARAARLQSGLTRALAAPMKTYVRARQTSADAHLRHADLAAKLTAVNTALRTQTQTAAGLTEQARRERAVVVQAITAQYLNGGSDGSVDRLLSSRSPSAYLDSQALQGYVTAGEQQVFASYLARQRRADAAARIVRASTAAAAALNRSMLAAQATWTTADATATRAHAALQVLLVPARRASITQPVALAAARRMRTAGH